MLAELIYPIVEPGIQLQTEIQKAVAVVRKVHGANDLCEDLLEDTYTEAYMKLVRYLELTGPIEKFSMVMVVVKNCWLDAVRKLYVFRGGPKPFYDIHDILNTKAEVYAKALIKDGDCTKLTEVVKLIAPFTYLSKICGLRLRADFTHGKTELTASTVWRAKGEEKKLISAYLDGGLRYTTVRKYYVGRGELIEKTWQTYPEAYDPSYVYLCQRFFLNNTYHGEDAPKRYRKEDKIYEFPEEFYQAFCSS